MMQDGGGQWYGFMPTMSTFCTLEKKHLPEHVLKVPVVENPIALSKLLQSLEDAGEVGRGKS